VLFLLLTDKPIKGTRDYNFYALISNSIKYSLKIILIYDNRRKQKRKEVTTRPNYSDFVRLGGGQDSDKLISSQLALAAFRYLSTCKQID
jgi:hypothetical protein